MSITFDPDKNDANILKHGISLDRAADLEIQARLVDDRFAEVRMRAYGLIDGRAFCLAYTVRNGRVRAISLRRAHEKEYRRHVSARLHDR